MPTCHLRWGFKRGNTVPFKYLLEEGAGGGQARGCSRPPAQPLTMTTASHHLKSIKSMENGGATAGG